jgi:hypothetical protein
MHVMIDLETLGTEPGSVILSLGAVMFNKAGLGGAFYCVFSRPGMRQVGLRESEATLEWWNQQDDRSLLVKAEHLDTPIGQTLGRFADWLAWVKPETVWGNGSDFDNVLLASAFRAAALRLPWSFRQNRCYRTIKSMYPPITTPLPTPRTRRPTSSR